MIAITAIVSFLAATSSVLAKPFPEVAARDSSIDGPLHANSGNYTHCPQYLEIFDPWTVIGFEQESYQGEWFTLADTEPTEPAVCVCDRITWFLDEGAKTFTDPLSSVCGGQPILVRQNGTTSTNPFFEGIRVEGSPDVPGALLGSKNQVLYIDVNPNWRHDKTVYRYQNAIVFSCGENFLDQPIFTSLQIFSRDPKTPKSEIDRLIKKAHELVSFDDRRVMYRQQSTCTYPPTLLKCPEGCPADKCVGGLPQLYIHTPRYIQGDDKKMRYKGSVRSASRLNDQVMKDSIGSTSSTPSKSEKSRKRPKLDDVSVKDEVDGGRRKSLISNNVDTGMIGRGNEEDANNVEDLIPNELESSASMSTPRKAANLAHASMTDAELVDSKVKESPSTPKSATSPRLTMSRRWSCEECRLRKRKCSGHRPTCIYCRKRNLKCVFLGLKEQHGAMPPLGRPPKNREDMDVVYIKRRPAVKIGPVSGELITSGSDNEGDAVLLENNVEVLKVEDVNLEGVKVDVELMGSTRRLRNHSRAVMSGASPQTVSSSPIQKRGKRGVGNGRVVKRKSVGVVGESEVERLKVGLREGLRSSSSKRGNESGEVQLAVAPGSDGNVENIDVTSEAGPARDCHSMVQSNSEHVDEGDLDSREIGGDMVAREDSSTVQGFKSIHSGQSLDNIEPCVFENVDSAIDGDQPITLTRVDEVQEKHLDWRELGWDSLARQDASVVHQVLQEMQHSDVTDDSLNRENTGRSRGEDKRDDDSLDWRELGWDQLFGQEMPAVSQVVKSIQAAEAADFETTAAQETYFQPPTISHEHTNLIYNFAQTLTFTPTDLESIIKSSSNSFQESTTLSIQYSNDLVAAFFHGQGMYPCPFVSYQQLESLKEEGNIFLRLAIVAQGAYFTSGSTNSALLARTYGEAVRMSGLVVDKEPSIELLQGMLVLAHCAEFYGLLCDAANVSDLACKLILRLGIRGWRKATISSMTLGGGVGGHAIFLIVLSCYTILLKDISSLLKKQPAFLDVQFNVHPVSCEQCWKSSGYGTSLSDYSSHNHGEVNLVNLLPGLSDLRYQITASSLNHTDVEYFSIGLQRWLSDVPERYRHPLLIYPTKTSSTSMHQHNTNTQNTNPISNTSQIWTLTLIYAWYNAALIDLYQSTIVSAYVLRPTLDSSSTPEQKDDDFEIGRQAVENIMELNSGLLERFSRSSTQHGNCICGSQLIINQTSGITSTTCPFVTSPTSAHTALNMSLRPMGYMWSLLDAVTVLTLLKSGSSQFGSKPDQEYFGHCVDWISEVEMLFRKNDVFGLVRSGSKTVTREVYVSPFVVASEMLNLLKGYLEDGGGASGDGVVLDGYLSGSMVFCKVTGRKLAVSLRSMMEWTNGCFHFGVFMAE
ncbi:hypothetical protein HDU76_013680 [Blyttiomyces sp. JEL0837]|nr:hypothetical protein HDU76_013680 [Blyttiomyces sp. JEL0837]